MNMKNRWCPCITLMTVPGSDDDLKLSWLHCNVCCRAFDHYNTVRQAGSRLQVLRSELVFFFTGCGHFFCSNCCQEGQRPSCELCHERSSYFALQDLVPEKVSMYLSPPISMLEDSLSIMMFQLNNANKLIAALRSKVNHQKELLQRAQQDLQRRPNTTFDESFVSEAPPHPQFSNLNKFSRVSNSRYPAPPPPSPVIHNPGRLSLKSPIITNTPNNFSSHRIPPPRPFRRK